MVFDAQKIILLFFDASLSLCTQKKMNDEGVSGQKKTVDWGPKVSDAEKKVNCSLGLDKPI